LTIIVDYLNLAIVFKSLKYEKRNAWFAS